jgi:GNAT superfamily N-acetyltransferase
MSAGIRLVTLADEPHHAAAVAAWWYAEWPSDFHDFSQFSADEVEAGLRESYLRPAEIPQVLLAIQAQRLIGTVSLESEDMRERPELGPWMASLYVAPDSRGRGVGGRLIEGAVELARAIVPIPMPLGAAGDGGGDGGGEGELVGDPGRRTVFLWAKPEHSGVYARRGWVERECCVHHAESVIVMQRQL